MTKTKENVKFYGIDYWNRPIFKGEFGNYFGSTDKLFDYGTTEEEILLGISEKDLTFFGRSFDCEPMGTPAKNIRITREETP